MNEIAHLNLHLMTNVTINLSKYFDKWQMYPPEVFLDISQNSQENTCVSVSFLMKKGLRPATLLKRLRHRYFPVNFAKFLITPFLQNTSGWLLLKWNKTKCLPLLIAFSYVSDINTTWKIDIIITWSFTMRYVTLQHHYDVGKRYHITMSLQCQYVIGLYRDVYPTKNRCRYNIGCPLGLFYFQCSHLQYLRFKFIAK